jgi:hypothetical protein
MNGIVCPGCGAFNVGALTDCLICRTALQSPGDPPPPPAAESSWRATHTVPAGGMSAWAAADGSQPPVAQLQSGVELELIREWGSWAEVRGWNGWTGWVDAGRLERRGVS